MKKVDYLIKPKELIDIDYKALCAFKERYLGFLNDNPFPKPPVTGAYFEMINYLKRKDINNPQKIGPYQNITIFEAANRIASDLVIINGIIQLVQNNPSLENARFTIRLGILHEKGKGDFTIYLDSEESEGESFNVAPSFLNVKLRNTISKWNKEENQKKLKYILVNDEAFEFVTKSVDKRVFRVKNWEI
ncbi:hypothetical protein [Chryseobacterium sp. BIGb0232]|uniref:hypothetical protein n=1 Tax=Chryseobacterium sp. BIGb0232 TaxID=2940598 RepID=UPI000F49A6F1|nr:hypothetical protein [Chryseobacterium sp. BIGb0232]MCS4300613.1 hypothetical protein [Chryseobacterium sp. BIGb0232]ROS20501.1 hypothetical protein EDF65_1225 [Chryseobacterium nakagawai]